MRRSSRTANLLSSLAAGRRAALLGVGALGASVGGGAVAHEPPGITATAGECEGSHDVPAADGTSPQERGTVVLFVVVHARDMEREGYFAVPIACADRDGAFVAAPVECLGELGADVALFGVDEGQRLQPTGAAVGIPDRDGTGLPLAGEPDEYVLFAASDPLVRVAPADCAARSEGLEMGPLAADDLVRSGLSPETMAEAFALLTAPWVADSALEADLDADGVPDRLIAGRFEVGGAMANRCSVVVLIRGGVDGSATVVDVACEAATDGTLSGRIGPHNLDGTSCWDLNHDGRVELWLSLGDDSMREREYVELRDGRFVRVGGSYWFGD